MPLSAALGQSPRRDVRTLGIVVAAGSGTRLGRSEPKALVPLAGEALIWHAAIRLLQAGCVDLSMAVPRGHLDVMRKAVFDSPRSVIATGGHMVEGGATRQASVARALGAADPRKIDAVLVHDAARPLAPVSVMTAVIDAIRDGARAVIPGLPVADTIKRVAGGSIAETLDRRNLVAVQTPQGFDFATLDHAHRAGRDLADDESTAVSDDAGLVERFLDVRVSVVPGAVEAMKITTAADLAFAEEMLRSGQWS